jgi:hypothetical protein
LDECEWIIEEAVRSKEYVRSRYDYEAEEDSEADAGIIESRTGLQGDGYKGVKVWEYWSRPSSKYPNGKRCVWVKDKLLEEDNQPFDAMPYVMFSGIDVPGQFWPDAVVKYLRGPQTELNKTKSQIAENRNRFGNPSLLKSRQATSRITACRVRSSSSTTPFRTRSRRICSRRRCPATSVEEIDRAEQGAPRDFRQHEVTSGQVPAG